MNNCGSKVGNNEQTHPQPGDCTLNKVIKYINSVIRLLNKVLKHFLNHFTMDQYYESVSIILGCLIKSS